MAVRRPQPGLDEYTIGWITILNHEFIAARAMIDVQHERPRVPKDPYSYAAGSINGHNVIVARTGEAGISPANNCATSMMRSFPNIQFFLLVGIGGGVPSAAHDIRLGDVVVSRPSDDHGGVIGYVSS